MQDLCPMCRRIAYRVKEKGFQYVICNHKITEKLFIYMPLYDQADRALEETKALYGVESREYQRMLNIIDAIQSFIDSFCEAKDK